MPKTVNEQLQSDLLQAGIALSEDIIEKLVRFIERLLEVNQYINLTAITDVKEALYKHLYDALLISTIEPFQRAERILDIGSGGGIPSIPLAIAFPGKQIYSLEATQKKVSFQETIKDELKIDNFHPIWNRAEILAHDTEHRERYDVVTARAVAAANILTELTIPFLKMDGYAIFYKGKEAATELDGAAGALTKMRAVPVAIYDYQLPYQYGERHLIVIRKNAVTPREYPRKPGVPQKKPLV
ncbi:MAG TPA: 16S rRNA (guanine(527)-N(7))-methyltransferase RsmG [Bacillota bacterium]|nr:16S rRNA (guanine(527)-N(7))-methyltransferase RsmG [Bacillota bacterium]HPT86345.1 16S rRNA (guanine(527)-N(7))-methyltransferase RsmG [Bacillota bacterium]